LKDERFQEYLTTVANKKYETDSTSEEWIILKKKYQMDNNNSSTMLNHQSNRFFSNTLHKMTTKTKQKVSKFSNAFHHQIKDKDSIINKSLNTSVSGALNNCNLKKTDLNGQSSFSASNLFRFEYGSDHDIPASKPSRMSSYFKKDHKNVIFN
jgi:hypothetical protein